MAEKTLVIATLNNGLCMANIEDNRVAEIKFITNSTEQHSIGDIFIGRVQKVIPSLNAAFIEIAPNKSCYLDVSKNKNIIFTHKIGKKTICEAEQLVVQLDKDAIKTKAPTVTSNLNFTGNYVVLRTGNVAINISSKIKDKNRVRLQELLSQYGTDQYGFIARTNARSATNEVIEEELKRLILEYTTIVNKAQTRTCYSCIRKAPSPYLAFIRDMYKDDISRIIIDQKAIYDEIYEYLSINDIDTLKKLELYNDSTYSLEKLYSLEIRIKEAMYKKVWMKSGAYLVIEPTEALTVIDVNSGKCVSKNDKEEQYFKINLEAAKEAAYQIRLRNISGIIIIDFINLKSSTKMKEILKFLKECLQKDRIPTKLIGVTKLQLVEITRKKNHKSLQESLKEHYE